MSWFALVFPYHISEHLLRRATIEKPPHVSSVAKDVVAVTVVVTSFMSSGGFVRTLVTVSGVLLALLSTAHLAIDSIAHWEVVPVLVASMAFP